MSVWQCFRDKEQRQVAILNILVVYIKKILKTTFRISQW